MQKGEDIHEECRQAAQMLCFYLMKMILLEEDVFVFVCIIYLFIYLGGGGVVSACLSSVIETDK